MTHIETMKQLLDDMLDTLPYNSPDYWMERIREVRKSIEQAEQAQFVANEVQLNIIRWWPDGFANRLEHVWKDLIGFTPNYKLYDLQRMMAEFGFTMKLYEGDAPPPRQTLTDEEIAHATAPVFMGGNPSLTAIARAIEAAHGITGEIK